MEGEGFSNRKWNVCPAGLPGSSRPDRARESKGEAQVTGGQGAGGGMGFLACRDHSLSVTPGPGSGATALPGGHTLIPESPHLAEPHKCQYIECVLSLWQLRGAGCGYLGSATLQRVGGIRRSLRLLQKRQGQRGQCPWTQWSGGLRPVFSHLQDVGQLAGDSSPGAQSQRPTSVPWSSESQLGLWE